MENKTNTSIKEPNPNDFGLAMDEIKNIDQLNKNEGVTNWFGNLYFTILGGGGATRL